jgi:hypothetical protein
VVRIGTGSVALSDSITTMLVSKDVSVMFSDDWPLWGKCKIRDSLSSEYIDSCLLGSDIMYRVLKLPEPFYNH